MSFIRDKLTSRDRALPLRSYIDPGFVNPRLVETIVGEAGVNAINELIAQIAPNTPDWVVRSRVHHIYTRVCLALCAALPAPTLGEVVANSRGLLVCSTEELAPCPGIYDAARVAVEVLLQGDHELSPELRFSTVHVFSDTLRSRLAQGSSQSFVATVEAQHGNVLALEPLVIGAPWLESDDPVLSDKVPWWSAEFYEHFVEDFDEFEHVRDIPDPSDFQEVMSRVSERAFKTCLGEILGDRTSSDWGGEQSDHYTSHIRLSGRRVTAAFLLKGPSRFQPMGLNHLGKNNDQIVRLAAEPADVLFVQHCHDILPPVRATLRAFAVSPARPRRYCLIDGRDSLRLLQAYDKVERALELSGRDT